MSTTTRRRWLGAIALGSAFTGGAWLARRWPPEHPARLPDMATLDGSAIPGEPSGRQGLFVTFWATTCTICVAEMPTLGRLHREGLRHGLRSVAVAMAGDRPEMLRHFARMNPGAPPIVFDEQGEIARALGPIRGTPTHLLLDAHNRIVFREAGALRQERLAAALRSLQARRA